MTDLDEYTLLKIAGAALLIVFLGFVAGRATAPGSDLEYVVSADKARSAQIDKCEREFREALELYKNTNEKAFTQLREAQAQDIAEIRDAQAASEKMARLAVAGCNAGVAH